MKVKVVYMTQVKSALGLPAELIEVQSPCTSRDLILQLANIHGDKFRQLVMDDQGKLLPSILLCIGDKQIGSDQAVELKEGDEMTILSAISGG